MIEILPEIIYQNPRKYGSRVYMGSCRIDIISSYTLTADPKSCDDKGHVESCAKGVCERA